MSTKEYESPEVNELDAEILLHASVLAVAPGDIIVFRSEKDISSARCASIMERADRIWPNNKSIVLTGGLEVGVLRPKDDG